MLSPGSKSRFEPDIGLAPIDPIDRALIAGDRQRFTEFLEPCAGALYGQPARIIGELADDLYAFYVADALAYLSRMLPAPRRSMLRRRSGNAADLQAPDPAEMERAPQQALEEWAGHYHQTGGMLLMEVRAIFRHLTVGQVFKARNLPMPQTSLAGVRFAEEQPNSAYLQELIVDLSPPGFYWDAQQLAVYEERYRLAFLGCLARLGVRFLRVSRPREAARLEEVASREGVSIADSVLRMEMPIDVYRKRRLEALAIFQEWVAPLIAHTSS